MRFYTHQHQFYCGIDLHARSMYVCILSHDGEILLHRNMKAAPEAFLRAIAPYRDGLVVAVECIFTWYWLADLCADQGIPFVLGHALYMKAIHGGKAKNDKIDSQKIAALLRGGMLPQAYVYPARMRATRDLLRRRTHLMRKRAELLAHVQNTNSQYNLPEIGKKIAYKANREGVAERFDDAAVQKTIEVDLAPFVPAVKAAEDADLVAVLSCDETRGARKGFWNAYPPARIASHCGFAPSNKRFVRVVDRTRHIDTSTHSAYHALTQLRCTSLTHHRIWHRRQRPMATPDEISLEHFQILTERAGLNLTPDEVAALKPMYDFYAAQIKSLHEIPLDAEDLAVSFSPTWAPQV